MARRGKRKSNAENEAPSKQLDSRRQPKIVESVQDSDDEEIDEDEAFNSEDERMFGHFFESKGAKRNERESEGDESDDDVTSEEDGDEDNSDDEDEEDDGGQYMLDLLNKLEAVGNKNKDTSKGDSVAQMAKVAESEYSSSISKKGLTLDNLMEGLEDTQGFKNLQKTFSKQQTAIPAPLDKVIADRTQRKMAYEKERQDISRWTKVVQENRQAETLDFKPKERLNITRDTLVDKFEPTTDFEKELEEALEQAGQQDEEAVLKAEEQALQDDLGANRLTMEEYKKRRGQLAQIRALMFYHEQKRHHIKKIKSKKYRRIRKKQRERLKDSALEAAMEDDTELANELKEKEEVARIQERMTLAHKNTSKWAKRVLKRGKNVDMETRRALSAQLKRGDDLRRKMMGDEDDNSDNDSDEDLVQSTRQVLEDIEATDPTKGKSGLFKLSFMQKGLLKQRDKARDETQRLLSELQSNEGEDDDENVQDDDSRNEEMKQKEIIASDSEMKHIMKSGELIATTLAFGNSNTISTSGGIDIDIDISGGSRNQTDGLPMNDDDVKRSGVGEAMSTEHVSTLESKKVQTDTTSSPQKKNKASAKAATKDAQKVTQVSAKKSTIEAEEENPWLRSTETYSKPSTSTNTKSNNNTSSKRGIVDIEGAANILDSSENNPNVPAKVPQDSMAEESADKKITMLSQEELIRRAFASTSEKEIDDEFQKEKDAMVAENDPTRQVAKDKASNEVVGWGSWAGTGAPPPPRRKKPLPAKLQAPTKKEDPKRKRKDEGKPDVIINQKRLKKTASTFMLGNVPHPFTSRAEYEQAMLGGIGREWNVTSSFKDMTRPDILTRAGKIIQPISKRAKVARAPAKF